MIQKHIKRDFIITSRMSSGKNKCWEYNIHVENFNKANNLNIYISPGHIFDVVIGAILIYMYVK